MSFYEASRRNTSPLVYMVEGILPENGAGFFWGPSGSGKTFTILDMALAVANGQPWLGHRTLPGAVAYAAGEGGAGLGIRIKARVLRQDQDNTAAIAAVARDQGDEAARALAATLPPYTSGNLIVTDKPFPMHFLRSNKPNDDLAQAMNELRRQNTPPPDADEETLANWPYLRLIILDALENFAGQLSVSNRSSANRIVATMQWMAAELQCCVLAVAHPVGRGENEKMVGSDRLFAAADFVIRYAPDTVAAPGALDTATISCQKSKDDVKFPPFGVELHPCEWDEPKLDTEWNPIPVPGEDGEQARDGQGALLWETEKVTSQTIRLIEQDVKAATAPARPAAAAPAPAPELRDNRPPSRIRPILRPPRDHHGLTVVPGQHRTARVGTAERPGRGHRPQARDRAPGAGPAVPVMLAPGRHGL